MKRVRKAIFLAAALGVSGAFADIAAPAQLNCAVTGVAPVGANFFGFGKGPVVGDTTVLDLGGTEVSNLKFSSGAQIGATVTKHNLVKQPVEWEGMSLFEVKFTSQSNGRNYHARLIANDEPDTKVKVALDVLEEGNMARLRLHSIELTCRR